ncbi:MAG: threonine/serine exporter family protein [Anaerocolumna sp.]
MNYKLLVDTAMLAGEIMLIGGAETYRVEDTMSRILKISGLEKTETFVTPTGIFLCLDDISIDGISQLKRVDNRVTNISHVYEANNVSRDLCNGKITVEEAYQRLKGIRGNRQYNDFIINLCTFIGSAAFTILLGGDGLNSVIAGLNGGLIVLMVILTKKLKISTFIRNLTSSILIAVNSMIFMHFFGTAIQLDALIGGSIMPLLPGVAITNAIRDTLQGDYVSGSARAIESFVLAASSAVGIGIGMAAYAFVTGGIAL